MQRLVYLDFLFAHGALGALQQGVDLAVAVLALRQPGLQQRQLGVLDQALIRQRVEALLQQGQFAVVEQRPGVLQQDIAQHADVAGRQRVVNGLRRIPQRQPAFCSGAVQPGSSSASSHWQRWRRKEANSGWKLNHSPVSSMRWINSP